MSETSAENPGMIAVLLMMTAVTGIVDAVNYLGLGHVFTANMTGNIVLLGFGIAGAGGLPVVAPMISLGAFLIGAGLGGKKWSTSGVRRKYRPTAATRIMIDLRSMAHSPSPALPSRPLPVQRRDWRRVFPAVAPRMATA